MKGSRRPAVSLRDDAGRHARARVLQAIWDSAWDSAGISRVDLTRKLHMSAVAASVYVREMIDAGLVLEDRPRSGTSGRRPIPLRVQPSAGYVIGVLLERHRTAVKVLNLQAGIEHAAQSRTKSDSDRGGYIPWLVGLIRDTWNDFVNKQSQQGYGTPRLLGIGLGLPGPLNLATGTLLRVTGMSSWAGLAVRESLAKAFEPLPVLVDNDANMSALAARYLDTDARNENAFVVVTITSGVGSGIVIRRRTDIPVIYHGETQDDYIHGAETWDEIYRGANGMAGEFGHTSVGPEVDLCDCGGRGCLELYCGMLGIIKHATRRGWEGGKDALTAPTTEASQNGWAQLEAIKKLHEDAVNSANPKQREYARTALRWVADYIGKGVVNIVNTLDPAIIILSGDVVSNARDPDLILGPVREAVSRRAFPHTGRTVRIKTDEIDDAEARGAGLYVLRYLFTSPALIDLSDPDQKERKIQWGVHTGRFDMKGYN